MSSIRCYALGVLGPFPYESWLRVVIERCSWTSLTPSIWAATCCLRYPLYSTTRELSLRRGKMWTTTHAFIGAPPKEAIRPFVQQNALREEWRCNEQVAKMIVAFVKGTFAVEFCLLFALRCFFLPNEQLRSWVATKLREISSQQFAKLALKLKWPGKQSIFFT